METFAIYIIKVNIVFTLLFLFYLVFLRRDTFYMAKRFYLAGSMVCAAFLPLFHLAKLIPQKESIHYVIILINQSMPVSQSHVTHQHEGWIIAGSIFAGGVLITLLILLVWYVQLFDVVRRCQTAMVVGTKVYIPRKEVNPFSFRGRIYLNPSIYSEDELIKIITHEQAHIGQKHGLDLMLTSFFQSLVWMNPFYYWFAASVRENVEFMADHEVIDAGNDPKSYQYALLKVAQTTSLPLIQHFNVSHLKKRIIMMNKKKTHLAWSGKYLLIFPVLLLSALLVNASELKSAWANADFSGDSSVSALSGEPSASLTTAQKTDTLILNHHSAQAPPLVIVDGKKASMEELNKLNKEDIKSINVFSSKSSEKILQQYGEKGPKRVIIISTKGGKKSSVVMTNDNDGSNSSMTIVKDGKTTQITQGDSLTIVQSKNGEVIAAKNGDVAVINSSGKGASMVVGTHTEGNTSVFTSSGGANAPLFIVDGKESPAAAIAHINPKDIVRVDVLKGESATARYGEKGANGVVLITTKHHQTNQ